MLRLQAVFVALEGVFDAPRGRIEVGDIGGGIGGRVEELGDEHVAFTDGCHNRAETDGVRLASDPGVLGVQLRRQDDV
ncbi:hypothetical protein [Methylotetracoccus oryzae]|uniref:hypothetical protein n=1 Tax=Methylotetracoccus oryzae TaxID=1919059 RepID=UPI001118932A|nr:hypothetical protein [Methylotetracoccus oryzae]